MGSYSNVVRVVRRRRPTGDAHTGLKKAIGTVIQGAGWQHCRVHFLRNVLGVIPKNNGAMVASIIRTIVAE